MTLSPLNNKALRLAQCIRHAVWKRCRSNGGGCYPLRSRRKRRVLVDVGLPLGSASSSCGKRNLRSHSDPPVDGCTQLVNSGARLRRQLKMGDACTVHPRQYPDSGGVEENHSSEREGAGLASFESKSGPQAGSVHIRIEGMDSGVESEPPKALLWADRDADESVHLPSNLEQRSPVPKGLSMSLTCQDREAISAPGNGAMLATQKMVLFKDWEAAGRPCTLKDRLAGYYTIADEEQLIGLSSGGIVLAINAGGSSLSSKTYGFEFSKDQYCSGGDVLETKEVISQTREPFFYQTARHGNVSYAIPNLLRGHYVVNLHFAEIVFTSGPPGMRVFDISIQGHKLVSHLDVYALVGSNKALILSVPATVSNGVLALSLEGVSGHPTISAICIHNAPAGTNVSRSDASTSLHLATEDEKIGHLVTEKQHSKKSYLQNDEHARQQLVRVKAKQCFRRYEEKLEKLKRDCHEAWKSLDDSQTENQKLRSELTAKKLYIDSLAIVVEAQQGELKNLRAKRERHEWKWTDALQGVLKEARELRRTHLDLSKEAKDWMLCFSNINRMASSMHKLAKEHELLKAKYKEESQERRELYNKIIELKGNIRVFCRCRPLNIAERAVGLSSVVEFVKGSVEDDELTVQTGTSCKKVFKFDRVFCPDDSQEQVFADTAPVVVSVLDGYNVCILAYGQIGTGKTFTMVGSPEDRGINYRTLEELFRVASEREGHFMYRISVSVLEVYNEQIRDLLIPPSLQDQGERKLEVKQVSEGVNHVPGLTEVEVHSMSEVWDVLQSGSNARAVGSTNCNEHSSRSHFVLCVTVKAQNLLTEVCTGSKLWLVDLAGSERVTKSDVQRDRLKEAQHINKSLASLGDVIYALSKKGSHIPFRNSKLTHLLQYSLGGDSKTLMFVQVSPNETDVGETLSSLNFASRMRGIELGPVKKQLDLGEMLKCKQQAEKIKHDMKKLEERFRSAQSQLQVKEQLCQSLLDKVQARNKSVTELELLVASEKEWRRQVSRVGQKPRDLNAEPHPQEEEQLYGKGQDRDRSVTGLALQVASELKGRQQASRTGQEPSIHPDDNAQLELQVSSEKYRQQVSRSGQEPGMRLDQNVDASNFHVARADCTIRRPLLERAVAYDCRQSGVQGNAIATFSSNTATCCNENADPGMPKDDPVKVLPLRFTSPAPKRCLSKSGRLLPSQASSLIKHSGQKPFRTPEEREGLRLPMASATRRPHFEKSVKTRSNITQAPLQVKCSSIVVQHRRQSEGARQFRGMVTDASSPAQSAPVRKQVRAKAQTGTLPGSTPTSTKFAPVARRWN